MTAQVVEFERLSTGALARRYAEAELKGAATGEQVQWLDDHRVEWLEALTRLQKDTEDRVATDRLYLAALRPASGQCQDEYLEILRGEREKGARRRVFMRHVVERRRWLVDLLADSPAVSPSVLVDVISQALELMDRGQESGAYRLLSVTLARAGR